jgi:hypothetical protein
MLWYSSVPPANSRSTLISPWPFSSKSFPIYHSYIIQCYTWKGKVDGDGNSLWQSLALHLECDRSYSTALTETVMLYAQQNPHLRFPWKALDLLTWRKLNTDNTDWELLKSKIKGRKTLKWGTLNKGSTVYEFRSVTEICPDILLLMGPRPNRSTLSHKLRFCVHVTVLICLCKRHFIKATLLLTGWEHCSAPKYLWKYCKYKVAVPFLTYINIQYEVLSH